MMDNRDRFLWVIVGGALALVIAGIVSVAFVGRQGQEFLPDDTPEGVVHNYFLALQNGEYDRAYGYLSDSLEKKPSASEFAAQLRRMTDFPSGERSIGMKVEGVRLEDDDEAWVEVEVSEFSARGPFERSEYTRHETVILRLEDGQWRIVQYFYPYWQWEWVNPPQPIPVETPH